MISSLRKYRPNFFVSFMFTRLLVALLVAWVYGVATANAPTRGGKVPEYVSRLGR
jgi:hypothetical protein